MEELLKELGFKNVHTDLYKHDMMGADYIQFKEGSNTNKIIHQIIEFGKSQKIKEFKQLMNIGDPRI